MIYSRPETPEDQSDLLLIFGLAKEPIFNTLCDGACGLTSIDWDEPFDRPDDPSFVAIFRDSPNDGTEAARGPRGFHLETVIFAMFEANRAAIISTRDTWSGSKEAAIYQEAADAAREGEIVFIIKTSPEQGPAWAELFSTLMHWIPLFWLQPLADGEDVE